MVLFAVIDIIGNIPIIIGLREKAGHINSGKASVIAAIVMIVFLFLGMGGLIYGLLNPSFENQKTLEFAVAACCLKHTIVGDYNLATLEEIEHIIEGDGSAKVSR